MIHTVRSADVTPQPWKNGGGRTRELLAWPRHDDWLVRVSVADIEADGPFSAFAGIDRCFAVLEGSGVVLSLPHGRVRLTALDDTISFAGEAAPMCHLIDGPTRDLNLMVRRGAGRASMQREPQYGTRWRGVFAEGTLWWTDEHNEVLPTNTGWHLSLIDR
jgi:uncharacterized protein